VRRKTALIVDASGKLLAMDTALRPVWALFIGGPLHGTWHQLPDGLAPFEHYLADGGMVPYVPRESIALAPGHAAFAPVGMTDIAIAELATHVPPMPPQP
jgi:hypothetical protein